MNYTVKNFQDILENFKKLATQEKQLSKEEETKLIESTTFPNNEVEKKVLLNNIGLVLNRFSQYRKLSNKYLTEEDIFDITLNSFIKAVRSYDSSRGNLSTFYYEVVKKDIHSAMEKNKRSVKIPEDKLVSTFKDEEGFEGSILDLIEDESARFEDEVLNNEFVKQLKKYMPLILSKSELSAINCTFFNNEETPKTASRQAISKHRVEALNKLRVLVYYLLDDEENFNKAKLKIGPTNLKKIESVIEQDLK